MVGVTTAWGAVWTATALGRVKRLLKRAGVLGCWFSADRTAEWVLNSFGVLCRLRLRTSLPSRSFQWSLPVGLVPHFPASSHQQMIRNCQTCWCVCLPRWACVLCVGAQDLRNSGGWKSSRFTVERYEQCGVAALHTTLRLSGLELGWRGFTWAQPGQHSEILPQKALLSENILILFHVVLPL